MPLNLRNMLATVGLLGKQYLHGEWKWEWKWMSFERLKQCPASLSLSASTFASTAEAIKSKSIEEMGHITKSLSAFSSELLACLHINKSSGVQDWFATLFGLVGKERFIAELKKCDTPLTDVSETLSGLAECINKFQADYICEKSLLNFEQAERALSNCLAESPLMKKSLEQAFDKVGMIELNSLLKTSAFLAVAAGVVLCGYRYRKEIMQFATPSHRRLEADLPYEPIPHFRDLEAGLPPEPASHVRYLEARLPHEPAPGLRRKVKAE